MVTDEFNHLHKEIKNYLDTYPIEEDKLQQEMRASAIADNLERWIIPAEVGRFFFQLTRMTGAKKIYEIGSYLGYSATWFAKALPPDGYVILSENNEQRYQKAVAFLGQSQLAPKVNIKHCDAHIDLENSKEQFDIILIDHDKPDYKKAYIVAKKKIKSGGIIIADNVLWRNRIVMEKWQEDPSTMGVLDFNRYIMEDPDMISLIVPIGDGVSLSYMKP